MELEAEAKKILLLPHPCFKAILCRWKMKIDPVCQIAQVNYLCLKGNQQVKLSRDAAQWS